MKRECKLNNIYTLLSFSGIFAVVFYLSHVLIGSALWDGYSHLHQAISDLTASKAPNRGLLLIFTYAYSLLAIIFASFVYRTVKTHNNKTVAIGAMLYLVMHLISFLYGFFPEDMPGNELSFNGLMHLILTACVVPLTILSPITMGIGFIKEKMTGMGIISILAGILMLLFGGIGVYRISQGGTYFGLFERLNIGTLQTWTLILSIWLLSIKNKGVHNE